jgi:hypothetical protein
MLFRTVTGKAKGGRKAEKKDDGSLQDSQLIKGIVIDK